MITKLNLLYYDFTHSAVGVRARIILKRENPTTQETMNFSEITVHSTPEQKGNRTRRVTGGALIVNADDWGRDLETTDRIFECFRRKTVSSVSGMVFMYDSVRAAAIAREQEVDVGLHLNLTLPFGAPGVPGRLLEHQQQVATYLLRRRVNQAVFHPGLRNSFKYVVGAQLEEHRRLYGAAPTRLDGHHHMHLCANVLFDFLVPEGIAVRRNFSFLRGEKGIGNRLYRKFIDNWLARRYRLTDFFFSLTPFKPSERLQRIFSLSHHFIVELETHPVEEPQYLFLMGNEFPRWVEGLPLAAHYPSGGMGIQS